MKNKLLISFSGGRTSAYMTWWLLNEWDDRANWEIKIVFANTGKEVEGTLKFIDRCSKEWGINIIWVEAVPNSKKGWAVTHNVVEFETASRNGEPFEAMMKKLGVPCSEAPFCSDQLKTSAIESYLKSIGWYDYYKAIGVRIDEVDRINPEFKKRKIMYPLIKFNPTTKRDVIIWWGKQKFDLEINDDLGNCDGCWKKSFGRLTNIARHSPSVFQWWQEMTDKYKDVRVNGGNFYRGGKSPREIIELSKSTLEQLKLFTENERLDGCSESCEAF